MQTLSQMKEQLQSRLVGQDAVIEQVLVGLLAGGHLLLEGPPGVGKTLLASSVSEMLGLEFQRVQFTPDLMPSDLTGVNLWNPQKGDFQFRQGPLFTELLLADELNRAPARTQAALLEAMQERQVSIDGTTHPLSGRFTVMATQNPFEYEGTYGLPEAQLDRFLLCIRVGYPSKEEARRILAEVREPVALTQSWNGNTLEELRQAAKQVHVESPVIDYINDLVHATRELPQISVGASPRSSLMLLRASQARAVLQDRDYVMPEDVQALAPAVLAHRLTLSPEAQVEGMTALDCVEELIRQVAIPR